MKLLFVSCIGGIALTTRNFAKQPNQQLNSF